MYRENLPLDKWVHNRCKLILVRKLVIFINTFSFNFFLGQKNET